MYVIGWNLSTAYWQMLLVLMVLLQELHEFSVFLGSFDIDQINYWVFVSAQCTCIVHLCSHWYDLPSLSRGIAIIETTVLLAERKGTRALHVRTYCLDFLESGLIVLACSYPHAMWISESAWDSHRHCSLIFPRIEADPRVGIVGLELRYMVIFNRYVK